MLIEDFDLNPMVDVDLYALHYVFLPRINEMMSKFSATWNSHPLRTSKNQTPMQLWTAGYYSNLNLLEDTATEDLSMYGVDWDGPTPQLETANNVEVPEVELDISDTNKELLTDTYNPLHDDGNFGINLFLDVRQFLVGCTPTSE